MPSTPNKRAQLPQLLATLPLCLTQQPFAQVGGGAGGGSDATGAHRHSQCVPPGAAGPHIPQLLNGCHLPKDSEA